MSAPYDLPTDTSKIKEFEWDDHHDFPRDLVGYGENSFDPKWLGGAKIAVSFVINYEEVISPSSSSIHSDIPLGAEHTVLNGDIFNYKYTFYAVGKAIEDNPAVGICSMKNDHDVASHAYRWIDYANMPRSKKRHILRRRLRLLQRSAGSHQRAGIMADYEALVWEVYKEMGVPLLWDSDSYAEDLPYWVDVPVEENEKDPKGMLMIPYSDDCNDYKFNVPTGFGSPTHFYDHVKNAFDTLYEEGCEGSPKMMTIALHCRCIGKPGRLMALKRIVEYIASKENVWVVTRTQTAEHFREKFPYQKRLSRTWCQESGSEQHNERMTCAQGWACLRLRREVFIALKQNA
ncbi:Chitin deacetylase [Lachnellula arida]|uniref:Chitin deacetylase n=1 Tax=Lachnellula arida TaxID=1316785 RepID=A0A8T9BPJ8_9HELO|nr:Chitin deacetylase [Lachnellula arida]